MRVFYSFDCPAFSARKRWHLSSASYAGSLSALSHSRWLELLSRLPPGSAFLQRSQILRLQNTVVHQIKSVQLFQVCCARTYLAILLISVPLAGWILLKRNRSDASKWPAFWVLFFYSANFGNVLGVSIVHSMEVARYSTVLSILALFAQLWAIRWLIEIGLAAFCKSQMVTEPKSGGSEAGNPPLKIQRSLQSRTILPELPDFISSMASLNCV
jgi:hypothetical protein